MKTEPNHSEFERFDAVMRRLLAMPHEVYQKRLEKWKAMPGTRGPKRKVRKPSAVPAPADPPQA